MYVIQASRQRGLGLSSIVHMRAESGLTLEGLSELSGIPVSSLSNWESMAILPGDQDMAELCAVFHCEPSKLLTYYPYF